MIYNVSTNLDLPKSVTMHMLWNIALDVAVGFVPVIGDVVDFAFKANLRNAKVLEQHLYKKAAKSGEQAV
jgi:hypothetical protein